MKQPTHALVLAVEMGAQVIEFIVTRGTEIQVVRAFAKWHKDINSKPWLKIPGELPTSIKASAAVGLWVVEIPEHVLKSEAIQKKWAGDPRRNQWMNQFVNGAQNFGQKLEKDSVDILDQGLKQ